MEAYRDKDYLEKFIDLIGKPPIKIKQYMYEKNLNLYSGNEIESSMLN